jgi:DNA invertase Pin-like site-specific DNA recombinase
MEQAIITKIGGLQMPITTPPLKYCLYARKSTEEEDQQALSIESQIKEMTAIAQKEKLNITEIKRESHSSKAVGQRPIFNQMIKEVKEGKFNALLTWAPDRLSRNAGDLGTIVDLMDQKVLLEIRTFSQNFTNDPNQKFLLMILGSQAKLENDNKSLNVKRGLRTKCEMGWRPSVAPTGYLPENHIDRRGQVKLDPARSMIIKQMFDKVMYEQWSGRKIYRRLNEIDFKTRYGKPLTLGNIYIILRNPFYYGNFEYPVDSGNWYEGKHAPIISKEVFDKVQEALNNKYVPKTESKEFAFTKLIKCGCCGSSITADEKFRKLENGNVNRHVYYFCTRSQDLDCKNPSIKEDHLIKELIDMIDRVSLDELGIKEKIKDEIERYNKFRTGVLGIAKKTKIDVEINARNYAKYILKEGSLIEKRELLACLKSKLVLKDRHIELEK